MKIVVLGGHGFVGKNLVTLLESIGQEVVVASRRSGLDLLDYDNTRGYLTAEKPNAIFNCAALSGSLHYVSTYAADIVHENTLMALHLYRAVAEACPEVRVINPVANCTYPGDSEIHSEPDWWSGEVHPSVYSYGNAKRMLYVISKCYQQQYGIRTLNFLVPNAFGIGDYTDPNKTHALNGMIIRMILAKRNGDKEFEIWGTGKPIREWAYVKDVANILARGLTLDADLIYPVNIAQNKGYSIKESAQIIVEAVGFDGALTFNTAFQDGAPSKVSDDKRFRQLFPDYEFYDHRKAIEETVRYYDELL